MIPSRYHVIPVRYTGDTEALTTSRLGKFSRSAIPHDALIQPWDSAIGVLGCKEIPKDFVAVLIYDAGFGLQRSHVERMRSEVFFSVDGGRIFLL